MGREASNSRKLRRAMTAAAVLAAASTGAAGALEPLALLGSPLGPATPAPTVAAPFTAPGGGYAGFATGTVLHTGLGGGTLGVDLVASTAAATLAPTAAPLHSELGRMAMPALPARGSFGHGAPLGLEAGLLPGLGTGLLGAAEAAAPPTAEPVEREVLPLSLPPLLRIAPLRGGAEARSAPAGCVLGADLAAGRSEAADVALSGLAGLLSGARLGTDGAGAGAEPLARSESRTLIVPGAEGSGRLALRSETVQTLAPVTLLAGAPEQLSISMAGHWRLSVTADGEDGAWSYGPVDALETERVLEVRNAAGTVVAGATASEMGIAGAAGLRLAVPGGELVVGEHPRARGGDGEPVVTGTRVEAAVDLVRARILGQEFRIGHMEAAVAVPVGGVDCPAPELAAAADRSTVGAGEAFDVAISVRNPNDGVLSALTVTVRLEASPGVGFALEPGPGGTAAGDTVAFTAGPLAPGETAEFGTRVRVPPDSGPGGFRAVLHAEGRYGDVDRAVPVTVMTEVDGPAVVAMPVTAPPAPPDDRPAVAAAAPAETPPPPAEAPPPPADVAAVEPAPSEPVDPLEAPRPAPPDEPQPELPAEPPDVDPAPADPPEAEEPAPPDTEEAVERVPPARRGPWVAVAVALLAVVAAGVAGRMRSSARRATGRP